MVFIHHCSYIKDIKLYNLSDFIIVFSTYSNGMEVLIQYIRTFVSFMIIAPFQY